MATEKSEINDRLQTRLSQGAFLANMLRVASEDGPAVQAKFVEHIEHLSSAVSKFLRNINCVRDLQYKPRDYWPAQHGRAFGFVDGGVANINLPGAAPLGIRVGTYVVRPGDESTNREEFKPEVAIVDDLYSDSQSTYDDRYEDRAKLIDAARIIAEAAGCLSLVRRRDDLSIVLVQGPLVNPVAPYGPPGFPAYKPKTASKLAGRSIDEVEECHFIPLYKRILLELAASSTAVAGVIERDGGSRPLILSILRSMNTKGDLSTREYDAGLGLLNRYDLSDAQIFDVVLAAGEYVQPEPLSRQGDSRKWPREWEKHIEAYPPVLTTYVKPSELVRPFRLEMFQGISPQHSERVIDLILHTSRLLPRYGFPAALDIADKFAKVPAWLSKQISASHKGMLLRKGLSSDNDIVREYAMKMLAVDARDWLYRPKS